MSKHIEDLIAKAQWSEAQREIKVRLKTAPDNHWLLTRLGTTYYEQRKYAQALPYIEKALAVMPRCPLVLWDYANTLDMLERNDEALKAYKKLIARGVESIAFDDCGEGRAWARGVIADSWYRIAIIRYRKKKKALAIRALQAHIALRGRGCDSLYSANEVKEKLAAYTQSRPSS